MKIVAKSMLIKEHILDKVKKGCDALEIQLGNELYNSPSPHDIKNLFDNNLLNIKDIYSVHLPLGANRLDTNLDDVFSSDRIFAFYDACEIAQKSSEIWNHPVRLILHFEMDFDKFIRADYIREYILNTFKEALSKYSNVIFSIENIIPILPKENGWYMACNYYDDHVKLVHYLRKELKTDRFSTVLDTCHAEMSIYYMNHILSILDQQYETHNMEDYFRINSELCDTIHLCTFKVDGYYKNHGLGFMDSKDKLVDFLRLWNKYTKNAALVLELREDNYLNSINFLENANLLKSLDINRSS